MYLKKGSLSPIMISLQIIAYWWWVWPSFHSAMLLQSQVLLLLVIPHKICEFMGFKNYIAILWMVVKKQSQFSLTVILFHFLFGGEAYHLPAIQCLYKLHITPCRLPYIGNNVIPLNIKKNYVFIFFIIKSFYNTKQFETKSKAVSFFLQ